MKKWHIWDFPGTVYVYLEPKTRELFFEAMFKKLGGKRPYARFLGVTQRCVKYYSKGYTTKNGIKHKQSLPISVFKKSSKLIDNKLKRKIESNILILKAKNKGTPIIYPVLPIKESPELYRIIAHVLADGSATKRKTPYYSNTCKELIGQFKRDIKIFGNAKIYETKLNEIPIVVFPKVITDTLSHIFNVQFSHPYKIPAHIFRSTKECKKAFLQTLFDDEGCISTNLHIGMANQNIVEEIRRLTENLGVKTNVIGIRKERHKKDYFVFTIKMKYLKDFEERIGFAHPEKSKNLRFAIKTQNREKRTRGPEKIKLEIIKSLERKPKKTLDIANAIKLTLGHTIRHLKEAEKEGIVKRRNILKNKTIWHLTKV